MTTRVPKARLVRMVGAMDAHRPLVQLALRSAKKAWVTLDTTTDTKDIIGGFVQEHRDGLEQLYKLVVGKRG